jgi:hypothetical protein
LFGERFLANWIFDVEILARMKLARRAAGQSPLGEALYEFPLDRWRDVAGSRVKPRDFVKAIVEMARLYWTYLRPGAAYAAPLSQQQLPPRSEGRVGAPALTLRLAGRASRQLC